MTKKKTALLSKLGISLTMILVLTAGCRDDFFSSSLKVDKRKVAVGEPITVTLLLKNESGRPVKSFDIIKNLNKKDFAVIGKNEEKGIPVGKEQIRSDQKQTKTLTYRVIPLTIGQKKLRGGRVPKALLTNGEDYVIAPQYGTLKSTQQIEVLPLKLDVSLIMEKGRKNPLVGESISFGIKVDNTSPVDIEGIEIDFSNANELKPFIKLKKHEFGSIFARNSKIFKVTCKTLRPGTIQLGRIVIKKIKTNGIWVDVGSTCLSDPGPTVTIEPPKITLSQTLKQNSVNLGEKFDIEVIATNHSPINVKDVVVTFEPESEKLKLIGPKVNWNFFSIEAGRKTRIIYELQAVESGRVPRLKAVVKEIQIGESRFSSENGFAHSNPTQQIEVRSVWLPGIDFVQTKLTPHIENFFNGFLLKTLVIALLLSALLFGFRYLINTALVESLFGKMFLNFFAAAFISQTLLFFATGCAWFYKTLKPAPIDIAALLTGSIFLCFSFGLIAVKDLAFGSILSGALLGVVSYMVFTGLKTYEIQSYENFPVSLALVLFFATGLAINLWIFRKN